MSIIERFGLDGSSASPSGPLLPKNPFPALSSLIAKNTSDLTAGLLEYHAPFTDDQFEAWEFASAVFEKSPEEWACLGIKPQTMRFGNREDEPTRAYALLTQRDHQRPFVASMPSFSEEANRQLTHQADVTLVEILPQRNVHFFDGNRPVGRLTSKSVESCSKLHVANRDGSTEVTDVELRCLGLAEVWWEEASRSSPLGVLQQVLLFDEEVNNFGRVFDWFWKGTEKFLFDNGARRCMTMTRSGDSEESELRAFLDAQNFPGCQAGSTEEPALWVEKQFAERET